MSKMAVSRKGIGTFRRSYTAQLTRCHHQDLERRMNPLHLIISTEDACVLKKSNDDDTFVCAMYVKREGHADDMNEVSSPYSPLSSLSLSTHTESPNRSNLGRATSTTNFVFSEDIVVCVWAKDDVESTTTDLDGSISIDGDSEDDELSTKEQPLIQLKCTNEFLTHYNLSAIDTVFIRAIEVFPLHKAIFSVSDVDCYQWLQQGNFAAGILMEICNHDLLVKQHDILLAPFPDVFLCDENFHRSWYFHIKAIACTPFQMGLITSNTEIIFYFEKAISRLPSDHRHLSGSHIDQYLEVQQNTRFMSDFCRSMSDESNEENGLFGKPDDSKTFKDFFLSSAFVIQQKIHWKKVLHHDNNFERLDLTTVLGMPKKMLLQHGIINGTIMKITLYPGDLFGENRIEDVKAFLKNEKPKYKFVKVQCLSKRLDESNVFFISSMLLFNLQTRPPVVRSPLLIVEKPNIPQVQSDVDYISGPKLSRSISTVVPFAMEVEITIVSSPSYTPKANHVESLNRYFQIPRLMSVDDIFAVSSTDDPEFWQESKVDTGVRKPVVFFKVASMSPRQPEYFAHYVDVNNSILKQIGSDHSYVPLSASKYLSPCDAVYSQSIVCPGLETYVGMLESVVLPHLNHKYDGATLVELTPSVLLTGPKGCGKNAVVYTVARRLYMHVMEVNCHDLSGDTAGASEARIKSLFLAASKYTPCILLLRHIEVIGKERDGTTEDPRTISAFGRCVRQLSTQSQIYPLIVIGTTHDQNSLSYEMLPSFLHEMNMEAPTEVDRGDILRGLLDGHPISPDLSISHLAQRTAGFVLGDLISLSLQALRHAYEKVLKICRPDGGVVSLQEEEDIVNAGIVVEQCDLDAALDEMQIAHSDSIGAPKIPSVKWSDIGGLADVKSDILDTIQLPLQHPELLAAGLRRSGVLLYGPPGTGKTLLAKAVATECSLNFLSVKGPELINMYVGQSEENVREVFKRARSASPCVIFFDELDSLAPNRGKSGDSGGVMDRVVSQLLSELDGLHESHEVFIIGATNRPDLLDPALLRPGRFDKLLYLGISKDKSAQLSILKALTKKFKLSPSLSLNDVAEKCPNNLTGADLYALCADAMLNAMRRKIVLLETEDGEDKEEELIVEWPDFQDALSNLTPSVSREDLEKYDQIRQSLESS